MVSPELERFMTEYEEFRRIHGHMTAFNLFTLLGSHAFEVTNSNLFAWLLDPEGTHDQGILFLRAFLSLCGIEAEDWVIRQAAVHREYKRKQSRIDLLIVSPGHFLVGIENKVYSNEGVNQLERQARDLDEATTEFRVPPDRVVRCLLSLRGLKPTSGSPEEWRSLSYYDVALAFRDILGQITAPRVYDLVYDWIQSVPILLVL